VLGQISVASSDLATQQCCGFFWGFFWSDVEAHDGTGCNDPDDISAGAVAGAVVKIKIKMADTWAWGLNGAGQRSEATQRSGSQGRGRTGWRRTMIRTDPAVPLPLERSRVAASIVRTAATPNKKSLSARVHPKSMPVKVTTCQGDDQAMFNVALQG